MVHWYAGTKRQKLAIVLNAATTATATALTTTKLTPTTTPVLQPKI